MRPLKSALIQTCAALAVQVCAVATFAQQSPASTESAKALLDALPQEVREDWYRVEVLIFARDTGRSYEEQWNPLPTLTYPDSYTHLIDPALSDRRLTDSQAFASTFDEQGTQRLVVEAAFEMLDDAPRPDAALEPSEELLDPINPQLLPDDATGELGADSMDPNEALMGETSAAVVEGDEDSDAAEEPDPNAPLLALPLHQLPREEHTFTEAARELRRARNKILFHESWWSPMADRPETMPLVIDRSGDPDIVNWPALQGSMTLYRSRYLHIDVNVWLNTMGEYLPEGWRIDAPPVTDPTVAAATLSGEPMDPWTTQEPFVLPSFLEPTMTAIDTSGLIEETPSVDLESARSSDPRSGSEDAENPDEEAEAYPWHHAITHQQARRMRSGEIHYLDHPIIGVIVQIVPVSEEALPLRPAAEREYRERHGLPVEVISPRGEDEDS